MCVGACVCMCECAVAGGSGGGAGAGGWPICSGAVGAVPGAAPHG